MKPFLVSLLFLATQDFRKVTFANLPALAPLGFVIIHDLKTYKLKLLILRCPASACHRRDRKPVMLDS